MTQAVQGLLAADGLDPALRPLVIDNLGLAMARVLRMATASVVFLAVALIVVMAADDDGLSTVIPRIAAGILGLALVVPLVWVARSVPGAMVSAVVRQRRLLGVRMAFVALGCCWVW